MTETTTQAQAQGDLPPGWSRPRPEKLPRPTYAPAVMAAGITLGLAGIVTNWIVSLVGLGLLAVALIVWIGALHRGD